MVFDIITFFYNFKVTINDKQIYNKFIALVFGDRLRRLVAQSTTKYHRYLNQASEIINLISTHLFTF